MINMKKKTSILIVDGDLETCITLKKILTKTGCVVRITHTGGGAIALVQEKAYDIIFIDMKLPTINGLETYLAIKEINPKATAIMMTGDREETGDLIKQAMRESAYTCLYKPLDITQLLHLVTEVRKSKKNSAGKNQADG